MSAGQSLEIPYKVWLKLVFTRPRNFPWDLWNELRHASAINIEYITRTLERHDEIFARYSERQVAKGLEIIETWARAIYDREVPWPERQRCIEAIFLLFEQVFAKRCQPLLSHLGETEKKYYTYNTICYMWWDTFPGWSVPETPVTAEVFQALLDVMKRTLALPSDPCRESALHGLGHGQYGYPQQIPAIIDAFLHEADAQGSLRPELREYALKARVGRVQ